MIREIEGAALLLVGVGLVIVGVALLAIAYEVLRVQRLLLGTRDEAPVPHRIPIRKKGPGDVDTVVWTVPPELLSPVDRQAWEDARRAQP